MATSQTAQLQVNWGNCIGDVWCSLNQVDSTHAAFGQSGVYVIWHGGQTPKVVRVGQATVFRDRLADHRKDAAIQQYARYGLYVTWAPVAQAKRDGVERYLAGRLSPLVGSRFPDATPISVNLPW